MLRRSGRSVTTQRQVIFDQLMGADDHPTAMQVFERLRENHHLSRTSVYRALDLFVKLGLTNVITDSAGRQRFDRNLAPHFHAVCVRCGKLHDIDQTPPALKVRKNIPAGFSVQSIEVEVRGFCSACRVKRWRPKRAGYAFNPNGEASHEHASSRARRLR